MKNLPDFFSKSIENNRYEIRKFSKICKDDEQTLLKSLNEKDSKVEEHKNVSKAGPTKRCMDSF